MEFSLNQLAVWIMVSRAILKMVTCTSVLGAEFRVKGNSKRTSNLGWNGFINFENLSDIWLFGRFEFTRMFEYYRLIDQ